VGGSEAVLLTGGLSSEEEICGQRPSIMPALTLVRDEHGQLSHVGLTSRALCLVGVLCVVWVCDVRMFSGTATCTQARVLC
jgi:hypothetical protein